MAVTRWTGKADVVDRYLVHLDTHFHKIDSLLDLMPLHDASDRLASFIASPSTMPRN